MMKPLLIAAGISLTVICWRMYGPVLHQGQHNLGNNRLKPIICVGGAYFVIAIILPVALLGVQGQLGGDWTIKGVWWSSLAGVAGVLGAMGIIIALTTAASPKATMYVMPLVFGGAPVVNVFLTMYWSGAWKQSINPVFYAGLILVIVGAATVLVFAPKAAPHKPEANASAPAGPSDSTSGPST